MDVIPLPPPATFPLPPPSSSPTRYFSLSVSATSQNEGTAERTIMATTTASSSPFLLRSSSSSSSSSSPKEGLFPAKMTTSNSTIRLHPRAHTRRLTLSRRFPPSATATDRGAGVEEKEEEKGKRRYPGEAKGFVEEMRFVAMRLHTKDQAKEGKTEPDSKPLAKWEPSVHGYLRFLVDSKVVYDALEGIVQRAPSPSYAEFCNTGLERSEKLAKDLKWFKEQGHTIPEPSSAGTTYACYLEELSEKNPQAFICHFYNVYFAHSAGGRMIGKKVAEKILNGKELEFYKWDGELSALLQNVRDKINKIASSWSREEKNHCLDETERSFKYSGEILRLILS